MGFAQAGKKNGVKKLSQLPLLVHIGLNTVSSMS